MAAESGVAGRCAADEAEAEGEEATRTTEQPVAEDTDPEAACGAGGASVCLAVARSGADAEVTPTASPEAGEGAGVARSPEGGGGAESSVGPLPAAAEELEAAAAGEDEGARTAALTPTEGAGVADAPAASGAGEASATGAATAHGEEIPPSASAEEEVLEPSGSPSSSSSAQAAPAPSSSPSTTVPVYFALVAPRPEAHAELLSLLQQHLVEPLVAQRLLLEFRVLAATPPSFVAEASTVLVFELVVPCPWPITDQDVERWQERLGSDVRLVIAPSSAPRSTDSWDAQRARSVLARAMVLPPSVKRRLSGASAKGGGGPSRAPASPSGRSRPAAAAGGASSEKRRPGAAKSWLAFCVDRRAADGERWTVPVTVGTAPELGAVDDVSGRRFRVSERMSLLPPACAGDLCQHLPARLRWRTAWRLAYSPRMHGVSLSTFHRKMAEEGPSLLILQDHHGNVFGGFASTSWHVSDRYFGDGESFVFRFRRRLPKPVLPFAEQSLRAGGAAGPDGLAPSDDALAAGTFGHAMRLLAEWHSKVRDEAERGQSEAAAAGLITSPFEALDAVLGGGRSPGGRAAAAVPVGEAAGGAAEEAGTPGLAGGAAAVEALVHGEDSEGQLVEDDEVEETDAESFAGGPGGDSEDELLSAGGDPGLEVFHSSAKDPFYLYSNSDCIAMGGGSAFALYVEKDLLHGMSEPSATFSSEQLSSTQNFIVSDLECWVFDDPTEVEDLRQQFPHPRPAEASRPQAGGGRTAAAAG